MGAVYRYPRGVWYIDLTTPVGKTAQRPEKARDDQMTSATNTPTDTDHLDSAIQGRPRARLAVEGMHCGSCVATVEGSLRSIPGVVEASVNLATGEAAVAYERGSLTVADLAAAIERAGYAGRPIADGD